MPDTPLNSAQLWRLWREESTSRSSSTAITAPQGDMSFEALFATAADLAGKLEEAGIEENRVVGLVMPNSLAFVPAFLALLKLSLPVALVSPKYRASEIEAIAAALRPQCFLTTPPLAAVLEEAMGIKRRTALALSEPAGEAELLFPASPSAPAPAAGGERPALIKFTSGSTGTPKGIALTAANILAEARNVTSTLAVSAGDHILAPVPVFHSYGFDLGVLSMLMTGAHLILQEGLVPRKMIVELAGGGATIFLGVPSIYRIFVDTPISPAPDLSHLRYLLSCTAPLPAELITAFYDKFRAPICQHYGSSETGAVTNHIPGQVLARPDSVGRALHNVQITIADEEGHALPSGSVGEVVVTSAVVSPGYIMGNPPGASRFSAGVYKTGDLGLLDEEGFLFLHGRKDDVINVGGMKVSPFEVVQVLERCPAVREAAVIGVKDVAGEEMVCALVTLKEAATESEILAFCRGQLSDYKIPRRIEIRTEMPRGPSGKIKITAEDFSL